MNCPRCGNNILPTENSCSKCGLIFINSTSSGDVNTNSGINTNNNGSNYQDDIVNVTVSNESVINDNPNNVVNNNGINLRIEQNSVTQGETVNLEGYFVGKNYDKIKKRRWSWNTLVFGFLYTLYRKMILISLIWIGVDIASVVIMGKYSIFVIVGLNIIMSFLVNYIYLALTDSKIDNIKRKFWGHSIDELIYRCSKKGGTSGLPLFFCGFAGVVACIVGLFLYMAFYPQYYVDSLYFRVPSDFEGFSSNGESRSSFQYADNINYCNIVASKEEDYDSIDSYIKDKTVNQGKSLNISTVNIWGREWNLVDIVFNDISRSYYYVTEKDNVIYSYEFNIYNGFGKKCDSYYNYVKNSMSIR
jgi:hypothetical protein